MTDLSNVLTEQSSLDKIVQTARDWADSTADLMRQEVSVDTGAGQNSLQNFAWKQRGSQANINISFKFLRYLVMVEKGAGRGHGGKKGSKWTTKSGEKRQTNPDSLGKLNKGARKAAPWFNPVVRKEIGALADAVAEVYVIEVKKILIK